MSDFQWALLASAVLLAVVFIFSFVLEPTNKKRFAVISQRKTIYVVVAGLVIFAFSVCGYGHWCQWGSLFLLEVVWKAFSLTVYSAFSTSFSALVRDGSVGIFVLLRAYRRGGKAAMKHVWDATKDTLIAITTAFVVVSIYYAIYKIPHDIRSEAGKVGNPPLVSTKTPALVDFGFQLPFKLSKNQPTPSKTPNSSPFALGSTGGFICPIKERSIFWMRTADLKLSPIAAAVYLHLTNISDNTYTLEGYSIEFETGADSWKEEPLLDDRNSEVFNIKNYDFKHARVLGFTYSFSAETQLRPIWPHETITGWVFLRLWEPSKGWRMRLRDVNGAESLANIHDLAKLKRMGVNFGGGPIVATTEYKDISIFPFSPEVDTGQFPK
jgi:hypothetical protein